MGALRGSPISSSKSSFHNDDDIVLKAFLWLVDAHFLDTINHH